MSEQTPLILLSELRRTWKMVRFWEQNNLVPENYVFRSEVLEEAQDRTIVALRLQVAERDKRIAELEVQLAEARKWVPSVGYGTGTVSYLPHSDWDTTGEDQAWKHLEDDEELPR